MLFLTLFGPFRSPLGTLPKRAQNELQEAQNELQEAPGPTLSPKRLKKTPKKDSKKGIQNEPQEAPKRSKNEPRKEPIKGPRKGSKQASLLRCLGASWPRSLLAYKPTSEEGGRRQGGVAP